ncbi:MAG: hypothetical protein WKG00_08455 [Polyangiaceae bacterium]
MRHAQICFSMAGAYAGSPLGPSTLPQLALARPTCDLRALVEDTVLAGCVGETLAACALAVRAAAADEPLRRLLRTMSMDEARHAALAWRIVAWAVRTGGQDIRDAAATALRRAVRAARSARDAGAPCLPEHGLPGDRVFFDTEQAALDEVVLPAAEALLQATRDRARGSLDELTA